MKIFTRHEFGIAIFVHRAADVNFQNKRSSARVNVGTLNLTDVTYVISSRAQSKSYAALGDRIMRAVNPMRVPYCTVRPTAGYQQELLVDNYVFMAEHKIYNVDIIIATTVLLVLNLSRRCRDELNKFSKMEH